MKRFHVAVFNYKRIHSFVENFNKIRNFNLEQDAVLIFDCSPESMFHSELNMVNRLCANGLEWGNNLFFIRRRNWGEIHGGQLDYFRCVLNRMIAPAKYSAFMQEHYLDLDHYVKEDTIPENTFYDLNQIASKFEEDIKIGCMFYTRYGIRVITSNPVSDPEKEFFGDSETLIPGAKRRGLLVDGGNFITRPELYINWFAKHSNYLTSGDGSRPFSIVWETRLGQILYDQRVKWYDLARNTEYQTIADLDRIENEKNIKISKLWYDHRVWIFFYAQDQWKYWPIPLKLFLRYLIVYIKNYFKYPRDISIRFYYPKG